jgi:hypothetical protein
MIRRIELVAGDGPGIIVDRQLVAMGRLVDEAEHIQGCGVARLAG